VEESVTIFPEIQQLADSLADQWARRKKQDDEALRKAASQFAPVEKYLSVLHDALEGTVGMGAVIAISVWELEPNERVRRSYRMSIEGKNPQRLEFTVAGNAIEFKGTEYSAQQYDLLFERIREAVQEYFKPPHQ
jgi:hypothetical protein